MNIPASRATVRWALRLFRREWRQQILVLALVTLAVAGAVFGASAAYNVASSRTAEFGRADHRVTVRVDRPEELASFVTAAQEWFGKAELIMGRNVPIPGSPQPLDIRAQRPGGPYGAPMLALRDGRFPTAVDEVALTDQVASDFGTRIGETVTLGRDEFRVVGTVENPADLGDEFALAAPPSASSFAETTDVVTLLVRASDDRVREFRPASDPGSVSVEVRSATEKTTAAVLVLVVSTVAMLMISLIAAASFVSVAQRRLRQLGMFAAVGGTPRQLRLVMIANGAAVGFVAAVLGTAAALLTWIVFAPAFESAAGHRVSRFGVPWWVLAAGFVLAIVTASAAAWLPARSIARVPIVRALSGRRPGLGAPAGPRSRASPFSPPASSASGPQSIPTRTTRNRSCSSAVSSRS